MALGPLAERPRHVLAGHEDVVVCLAVSTELDLVVSGAADGTLLFHTLRRGRCDLTLMLLAWPNDFSTTQLASPYNLTQRCNFPCWHATERTRCADAFAHRVFLMCADTGGSAAGAAGAGAGARGASSVPSGHSALETSWSSANCDRYL